MAATQTGASSAGAAPAAELQAVFVYEAHEPSCFVATLVRDGSVLMDAPHQLISDNLSALQKLVYKRIPGSSGRAGADAQSQACRLPRSQLRSCIALACCPCLPRPIIGQV
jgi:hypothetical protein